MEWEVAELVEEAQAGAALEVAGMERESEAVEQLEATGVVVTAAVEVAGVAKEEVAQVEEMMVVA